jgi:DNA-binding MarR family transcriptional regulator
MPALTDDQLAAWKRLQWATALITTRFRRDLAAAGLSLEQFDVLVHLAWAPSGTLPLHELTASMVIADALSRSGITRLLDRMETSQLITRTVSTSDRRRFDVALTPHGRARFDQAWPAHAEGISRYFAQPLTSHDISELTRILDTLIQANQNPQPR